MKKFTLRFSLAAMLVLGVTALSADMNAQSPTSQEPAATAPTQSSPPATSSDQQGASEQEPTARPQQEPNEPAASSSQNEPQMPAAGEVQTQDAKAFTGRIVKENGKVVLKDPVTKTSYQIDDVSKVKAYMGKEVKVIGKLDMNSNMIHVESVAPIS